MYEFPKPGFEQKQLLKLTGEYNSKVKFYFMPDQPPMESEGKYVAALDVGGYFLIREFKVRLDDAEGFTGLFFHGKAFTGYDPYQKKYIGSWIDSGSPAVYNTTGSFNDSGNIYSEISIGPDPEGNPLKMKMTTEIISNNQLLFVMYRVNDDDSETLITEIVHTKSS